MSSIINKARLALVVALATGALATMATPAAGQAEEARGGELLRAFEAGQRSCADLSADDFTAIGEYVMERMIGSPQGHQSMDEFMSQMMGAANEERMHEFMGRRITGCGGSQVPAGAAGMMGMAGMMGGGALGTGSGGPYGPAGMMGFASRDRDRDDDVGAGWMVAMMLVLVGGAAIAAFLVFRTSRRPRDPGELLAQRFARGEIGAEEYQRRRAILGGTR